MRPFRAKQRPLTSKRRDNQKRVAKNIGYIRMKSSRKQAKFVDEKTLQPYMSKKRLPQRFQPKIIKSKRKSVGNRASREKTGYSVGVIV